MLAAILCSLPAPKFPAGGKITRFEDEAVDIPKIKREIRREVTKRKAIREKIDLPAQWPSADYQRLLDELTALDFSIKENVARVANAPKRAQTLDEDEEFIMIVLAELA